MYEKPTFWIYVINVEEVTVVLELGFIIVAIIYVRSTLMQVALFVETWLTMIDVCDE
jgi:hypothetical protein